MRKKGPGFGIYLKTKLEKGFSNRESVILFGPGHRLREIVQRTSIFPYEGGGIVRATIRAYSETYPKARVEITSLNGQKREYEVPKEQLLFLDRRQMMEDRRRVARERMYGRRKSIEDRIQRLPGGVYMEVMHDNDRKRKMPKVKFNKGCKQSCKVYSDNLIYQDKKFGFLRIMPLALPLPKDPNKNVRVKIEEPGKRGRWPREHSIPRRYLHIFNP